MIAALVAPLVLSSSVADLKPVWQIGKPDSSPLDLAFAPGGYAKVTGDAFYIVGRSDARTKWPYVQPGPSDPWGESRKHRFEIVYALAGAKPPSDFQLKIAFFDTHASLAPKLSIWSNGTLVGSKQLPNGLGDDSVFGRSKTGKPFTCLFMLPAKSLKNGLNSIAIVTEKGSWAIYDSIQLFGPKTSKPGPLPATVATFQSAPSDTLAYNDGKPSQFVKLRISHSGQPTRALVQADTTLAKKLTIEPGESTVEIPIQKVQKPTARQFRLLAESVSSEPIDGFSLSKSKYKTVAAQTLDILPVRQWTVFLVPHSHVDIGYTDYQDNVKRRQWQYLEYAIRYAAETKDYPAGSRFVWNAEVMWPIESYLREQPKEKRTALLNAIKEGSIALDALYGNELTGLCQADELFELIHDSLKIADWADSSVKAAMISDVPGYSWGIVPALAKNGIRFFSCGPNTSDRIGYTLAQWADKPFWWQGPNPKDKVLTWVLGTGYSTFMNLADPAGTAVFLRNYLRQLEVKQYPYDIAQVRFTTGGDNGPPDRRLSDFVRDWNKKYAYPRLVISTADAAFAELEKRYAKSLPTYRGDFTPYWEDGAPSTAQETAMVRQAASRMTLAEAVAVLRSITLPQNQIADVWRYILLFNEHTWGAYCSVSDPDNEFTKKQWEVKKSFADLADVLSKKALDNPLPRLEGQIEVYNALSWPRSGIIELPDELDIQETTALEQKLSDGRRLAYVQNVPGLGSSRFPTGHSIDRSSKFAKVEDNTLENIELKVVFDMGSGSITSAIDKKTGRELVDSKQPWGNFLYLLGSDVSKVQANGKMKLVRRENGPIMQSMVFEGESPGCKKLTREFRLIEGTGAIEVIVTVDKKAVREKEGVHLGFGFNVPGGQMRYGTGYGMARPEIDQLKGACKNWFSVERWVDCSNKDFGVTWVTLDAPLVEFGKITATLPASQPDPNAYRKNIEPNQTLFSWAINNHWHTNYKADQEGLVTFRYAIRPHGPFKPEDAQRFALEQSIPLHFGYADAGQDALQPLLAVSPSSVLVTRLRNAPTKGEFLVRLYNCSDKPVDCSLTKLPLGLSAYASDAIGNKKKPIEGPIAMAPWDVVTVVLKIGR